MEELQDEPPHITAGFIKDLTDAALVSVYPHDTYTSAARRQRLLDEITSRQQADREAAAFTSFFRQGTRVLLGVFVQSKPGESRRPNDPGRAQTAGKGGQFVLKADGVERPEDSDAGPTV